MTDKTVQILPLAGNDLGRVLEIQRTAYHAIVPEADEVMVRKFELCPNGCFAAWKNGRIWGYILSHPWTLAEFPVLDTYIEALPDKADSWYIHDLAMLKDLHGCGAGRLLVERVLAEAEQSGFLLSHLVSIQDTKKFWEKNGYKTADCRRPEKLRHYGESACYMVRNNTCGKLSDNKSADNIN